jgi:hypothetical protein
VAVSTQATLSASQIEAFYHDQFVDDQVRDFMALAGEAAATGTVVDVGGGVGHFAHRLAARGLRIRVIDMDPVSVAHCRSIGLEAAEDDALSPNVVGDESVACFNLILHHLVARNEATTRQLQSKALNVWKDRSNCIFVNEYIYESFLGDISGRIIYMITSNQILSMIGKWAARIIPAFKANTFGIGVRFRAHREWQALFAESGFVIVGSRQGAPEPIALPLRGLLIKTIRRDSFLLRSYG